ncbi:3,4-dihydroxy-2-butanone-4-phosphate synthase [Anaplasma bovis]|uniref:3,4-dihydroxy-2-butanone-4-phosphate synthase n=1 Tax=Anaplasma bovis TaxID=186733 RepID=UPI002FF229E4
MSVESEEGEFSSVADVIKDAAEGKVFILLDDEDRENEGDLVVLADKVSESAINMMIRYGSGIVCLAILQQHADRLGLDLLKKSNAKENHTAFTTSIDARYGISTGVSARDRATTIKAAVREGSSADELVTPGHVFPIIANEGGLAARKGHTEASVEIAKLAGKSSAAVICELMNEDGTMSRLPEIIEFSSKHQIKLTTIGKLMEYLELTQ